jgi:hypothetical protein
LFGSPFCDGFVDFAGDFPVFRNGGWIFDPGLAVVGDGRGSAFRATAAQTFHPEAEGPLLLEPLYRDSVLGKRHTKTLADAAGGGKGKSLPAPLANRMFFLSFLETIPATHLYEANRS